MSFLARSVALLAPATLLALAACSTPSTDDGASSSEANLDQQGKPPAPFTDSAPADGPLTLDATYGTAGTLQLAGTSSVAIGAARRADGSLAVLRNADGNAALTVVAADGTTQADAVLVTTGALQAARVHPHTDGLVVVGQIPLPDAGARYFVARIGADGAVDQSFTPDPLELRPVDSAVSKDGHIVIAGVFGGHAALVRLNANGSLDATFGEQGLWQSADATAATKLALASDGSIYVVDQSDSATSLLHLSAEGKTDAKFGKSGAITLPLNGGQTTSTALVATDKGLTYVGPTADEADSSYHTFAIAADGTLTPGKALAGQVITPAYGNFVSAVTDGDKCTVHVTDKATTDLAADQCSLSVSYVGLGDGKRAVIFNTVTDGIPATSIRVFGN